MIQKFLILTLRLRDGLGSRWRNLCLRLLGAEVIGYCWLRPIEVPRMHSSIRLDSCSLDTGVVLLCSGDPSGMKISIGSGTYLNRRCFIDAAGSITIGKHVAMGPGCYITDHDHGTTDPAAPPLAQPLVVAPTRIDDSAWIGAHVVILKGVTIGARAVIGAGSVVTKDVPPGCTAIGVPARIVRRPADPVSDPGTDAGARA